MAFEEMNVSCLTLQNYVKCLKTNPKKASLFLKNKVLVSKNEKEIPS
jgi:hypothetical protein